MTCPICNDERMIPDSDGEGQGWINCFKCAETMGGPDLRDYLYGLGISIHVFAEMANVQDRTVRRWIDDYMPVPHDVHSMVIEIERLVCEYVYQVCVLDHDRGHVTEDFLDRMWINEHTTVFQELINLNHGVLKPMLSIIYSTMERRAREFNSVNGRTE
jgi:hypothetical protein